MCALMFVRVVGVVRFLHCLCQIFVRVLNWEVFLIFFALCIGACRVDFFNFLCIVLVRVASIFSSIVRSIGIVPIRAFVPDFCSYSPGGSARWVGAGPAAGPCDTEC